MSVTSIQRPKIRRVLNELPQYAGHDADAPSEDDRLLAIEESFCINRITARLLELGRCAVPALREELSLARGIRRQSIVNTLWHYHEREDAPVFISELQSGDRNRRRQAATFLADCPGMDIRRALVGALSDPEPIVRASAIRALRSGQHGLPPRLRPRLLRDPDPGVRQAIIEHANPPC